MDSFPEMMKKQQESTFKQHADQFTNANQPGSENPDANNNFEEESKEQEDFQREFRNMFS